MWCESFSLTIMHPLFNYQIQTTLVSRRYTAYGDLSSLKLMTNKRTDDIFLTLSWLCDLKPVQQVGCVSFSALSAKTCFPLKSLPCSKGACRVMVAACILMLYVQTGEQVCSNPSSGEQGFIMPAYVSVWCTVEWMHRRPCRKIDFNNNGCQQEKAACLRRITESQAILGGQIHNAEIPRGSTCLLTTTRTHTFLFPALTHSMQGQWRLLLWWCEVQSGAPLEPRVFVPLSWALLPSDDGPIVRASSGPAAFRAADKAPFHQTEAEEQGGGKRREREERGSDGSVERQRRWESRDGGLKAGEKGLRRKRTFWKGEQDWWEF